jgi:hypothetical protein
VSTRRCAICFATDAGYLVPTLVAAAQARRWSAAGLAEVMVFAVGLDAPERAAAAPAFAEAGVRLVQVEAAEAGGNAMMARLMLDRLVPAGFAELLYLDADVQVVGPLDPLLAAPVPAGRVRAALDPMALRVRAGGRDGAAMTARMRGAGVAEDRCAHYFNSGVLHIARDGWAAIGAAALALHRAAPAGQPFPDQDALNIAVGARAMPMSLAWNFPAFLRNAGLDREIRPAIVHFMARPKPWQGCFPPWTAREVAPYRAVLARYPALVPLLAAMPPGRRWRYAVQQRGKQVLEALTWGRGPLRRVVLEAEEAVSR